MTDSLTTADREFLAGLQKSGPQCVKQLCESQGVTPNAIRHRLNRLLAAGLIEKKSVQADRGRPFHEYGITRSGRRTFGDDYATLAKLLWHELNGIEDRNVRERMISRLRQSLVDRYQAETPADSLPERFNQLQQALDREGFEVGIDQRESADRLLPVLREYTCPYNDLAAEDRSICDLEQSVFQEVLGVPVALTQCCHDGHSCCEFEPAMSG